MPETNLEQLIYTSKVAKDLDAGDLFKLVEKALYKNAKIGITGLLVFANGRFFQAIEGESMTVTKLMATIERDDRHDSIVYVMRHTIPERQFLRWRMRRMQVRDKAAAWGEFERLAASHSDALSILEGFESFLALKEAEVA